MVSRTMSSQNDPDTGDVVDHVVVACYNEETISFRQCLFINKTILSIILKHFVNPVSSAASFESADTIRIFWTTARP